MLGPLDCASDELPCKVEDRLDGLFGFIEQRLGCGSDGAEQPALALALRLLMFGRCLLLGFVARLLGLLLPLLVVGRRLPLCRAPLFVDGLEDLCCFRITLALCARDQLLLSGRPLAAEPGHFALGSAALARLLVAIRLLELRHLGIGFRVLTRGALRILLTLTGE